MTPPPLPDAKRRRLVVGASIAAVAACAGALPGCQSPRDHAAGPEARRDDSVQRALATDIAARYDVRYESALRIVDQAHAAAAESGLDPLLVLAVIAVESRFEPAARNASGAQGLMQIIPKFHLQKLAAHGGPQAVLDPGVNIRVGTAILADYIARSGSVEAGLQRYVGASDDPARSYARRVRAERARLQTAAARDG